MPTAALHLSVLLPRLVEDAAASGKVEDADVTAAAGFGIEDEDAATAPGAELRGSNDVSRTLLSCRRRFVAHGNT